MPFNVRPGKPPFNAKSKLVCVFISDEGAFVFLGSRMQPSNKCACAAGMSIS